MIHLKTQYVGMAVPGIAKRKLPPMLKAGFARCGKFWHGTYREKHFTKRGAREYGYTPRKGERGSGRGFHSSYTARKLREKGHTLPLVWSGESRSYTRVRDVRATSTRVRVVMRAPKLNYRHPASQINMRDEMTRVSIAERNELIRVFDRDLDRRTNSMRDTRIVRS